MFVGMVRSLKILADCFESTRTIRASICMLPTTLILERLYGVPRHSRSERFRRRVLAIQKNLARWLEHQRWGVALAASIFIILGLAHGYYYNMLFVLQSNVHAAQAKIEAGQQRRNHIKRNLVQLMRFYADYERQLMKDVTKMRGDAQKSAEPNGDAMGLLGRLNAVAEQYPSLHLTNTAEQFMTGVVNTESEIAGYIIDYNRTVNMYRTAKTTFPAKIFSAVLGFPDYSFYQPEDRSVLEFKELKL
jgi:LemA protein